ncbi:MAG: CRISPR-associated protein Cas4 [Oscillochloridaceae bacterium]|nr:CRISPR-associated protein Cas4 [Chloroflexaceae bacterium]MDW8392271.1 CRISPR-associated protein Cas4 [Oscillochloridaceae bacterium]
MLGGVVLCLGLLLLVFALVLRQRAGLPWGRVAAMDVGAGRPLERPLVAMRYRLAGKPDYLIERGGAVIPVEVKPGRRAPRPYDSDLMQLAAYCLLVEETTGRAPPWGFLRYADATFRLAYTPAVRRRLVALLDEMQALLDADDVSRSHDDPRRCAGCGFRTLCDDALAD